MKNYDKNEYYRAHLARDARFDGKFFVAVRTTMIYCRPICPARKAKLVNLTFYTHAAEAEEAGYRPCLRCRPESAPGSPAWIGTSATVRRAVRMMDSCALDGLSIKDIAEKLGVGERWLRDLFQKQVGASPKSILIARKLDIAKNLLENTALSIIDVAFSSGFQSIRRFNDAFKIRFKQPPSKFRKKSSAQECLSIQISYRPPYAWDHMIAFLQMRAVNGVEWIDGNVYQRSIAYHGVSGWMRVSPCDENKLRFEFGFEKSINIVGFVARLRNMFDLDADPLFIEKALSEDEMLRPYLQQFQGLRIPGAWDGFELAVRAIVGQRISVKAASTILGRITTVAGEPRIGCSVAGLTRLFPTPERIMEANLSAVGLPASRVDSIKCLSAEINCGNIVLDGTVDFGETCRKLLAIKGIGKWTVSYIAMRALKDPDAIPETDLIIQQKIKKLGLEPANWAPWRAYAAILLWNIKL